MIHEAYMPVYRCPDFHCVRVYGRTGPPEVVQEALADLKIYPWIMMAKSLTVKKDLEIAFSS